MATKVIFIVGPTATGKTSLAIKLAKEVRGEIISADSMQGYRGMDILSQKPTAQERKRARHHLISVLSPDEEYSAAQFSKMARKIIKSIISKKKIPIVTGGSGLYIRALADGIFPSKGKDENLRTRLARLASEKGAPFLHKRLKKIDPVSAARTHPNDLKKIIRALEIYKVEKKTKTALERKTEGLKDEYDLCVFGLTMKRENLYDKINKRVDIMFKKGIVREVRRLLRRTLSLTSARALGIKEIRGYLDGQYSIDRAKDMLKRDTRRFAKRQLTWFRADKRIRWIDLDKTGEKETIDIILKAVRA